MIVEEYSTPGTNQEHMIPITTPDGRDLFAEDFIELANHYDIRFSNWDDDNWEPDFAVFLVETFAKLMLKQASGAQEPEAQPSSALGSLMGKVGLGGSLSSLQAAPKVDLTLDFQGFLEIPQDSRTKFIAALQASSVIRNFRVIEDPSTTVIVAQPPVWQ